MYYRTRIVSSQTCVTYPIPLELGVPRIATFPTRFYFPLIMDHIIQKKKKNLCQLLHN